jgi:uncharacterized protein YukE
VSGYAVDPAVLAAHSRGTRAQATNFTALARLLDQGTMPDDCFGPGLMLVRALYTQGLRDCRDLATRASAFLDDVAERVADSGAGYEVTDAEAAAGLTDAGAGPGTIDDVATAGNPKNFVEQALNYGSSAYNASAALTEATNPSDPGSPPQVFFATVNGRIEQLATIAAPGKALFDNGFGVLVALFLTPVLTVAEELVGDPEQMRATAKGWAGVATWLTDTAERERDRATATIPGWQGSAGDRFRDEMVEFADGVEALAADVHGVRRILETTADIFDMFVMTVVDMVQEYVIGLLVEWIAASAAAWCTGGASIAAAETSTVTRTGRLAQRLAAAGQRMKTAVNDTLGALEALLVRIRGNPISGLVTGALHKAQNVPVVGKLVRGNPITGALAGYKDMDNLATHVGKTLMTGEASGTEALARRAARLGLGIVGLSGHASVARAATAGALENVPGAAVQITANQVYDTTTNPSNDERGKAQDEGFTLDEDAER